MTINNGVLNNDVLDTSVLSTSVLNNGAPSSIQEPNDTIETAIDTGLTSEKPGTYQLNSTIGDNPNQPPERDIDVFKVELAAGQVLSVDLTTQNLGSALVAQLGIFAPDGSSTVSSYSIYDEFGGFSGSFSEFRAETAGTYYLTVSGANNYPDLFSEFDNWGTFPGDISNQTGDYTIKINRPEAIELTGTSADDILIATNEVDKILGLEGNDSIQGLAGLDDLAGGAGNDVIFAGQGNDFVNGDSGNDVLWGEWGNDELSGGEGDDLLNGGDDDDRLMGGDGNDHLQGGTSYDSLDGGSGNDVLIGIDLESSVFADVDSNYIGFGQFETDTLIGGAGQDTFVLGDKTRTYYDDGDNSSSGEYDYAAIVDFTLGEDVIQLHGSANAYALDFFTAFNGTTSAAIIYDAGLTSRGEVVGILESVSTDLSLTNSSFRFV